MKRIFALFMMLCLLLCACSEGELQGETAAQPTAETTAKTTYTYVSVLGLSVDLPINSAFRTYNYEYADESTLAVILNESYLPKPTPTVIWNEDECEALYIIPHYVGTRVDIYEILEEDEAGNRSYSDEPTYSAEVEDGCVIYAALDRPKETAKWYIEVVVAENEYGGRALKYDTENSIEYIDGSSYIFYTSENETPDCMKPVIYLYPEEETEVTVKLDYQGDLTCTYPVYENGWTVTAQPDGTLTDQNGQSYNYLYWEGKGPADYDFSTGFCVKGEDTAAFLEAALEKLGLNRREANEFIVFWLPMMQNNPYNIISFQTEAYTDTAPLTITPTPDTLLRVYMAWYRSQTPLDIAPQQLNAPERSGFLVVEWGGSEMK